MTRKQKKQEEKYKKNMAFLPLFLHFLERKQEKERGRKKKMKNTTIKRKKRKRKREAEKMTRENGRNKKRNTKRP